MSGFSLFPVLHGSHVVVVVERPGKILGIGVAGPGGDLADAEVDIAQQPGGPDHFLPAHELREGHGQALF